MKRKLKIAIIADPILPVPPLLYGGIERIIAVLIKDYMELGHEISLFAHQQSNTKAKLFPYPGKTYGLVDIVKNMFVINKELYLGNYDIVHCFGRLLYLLPQLPTRLPKIMSYQREPTTSQVKKAMLLSKKNSLAFTGCSKYISNQIIPFAATYSVFNGVDLTIYDFKSKVAKDAPLIFLGRIESIKGTHIAIDVAIRTNKKLIIAGNIPSNCENYFDQYIKPALNEQITYVGPINDIQKNNLLGIASAFLMPIGWNEPFGIVMAEAMACGTPVIAFDRGSVPEVVINSYNGYIAKTIEDMVIHVNNIEKIDRKSVRKDAEERFASQVIANQYLNIYQKMIKKPMDDIDD